MGTQAVRSKYVILGLGSPGQDCNQFKWVQNDNSEEDNKNGD